MINRFDADSNLKPFLSIREASQYLGVEYKTLYRIVLSGKLPASRVGGIYRIKREDLDRYLDEQKLTTRESFPVCGRCRRMIRSPELTGGRCQHAACEALLCRTCWADEQDRYCLEHKKSPELKLAEAQQRLAKGETAVLVTAAEARAKELNFIGRFDQRIRQLREVISPVDGRRLHIKSWEDIHEEHSEGETAAVSHTGNASTIVHPTVLPRNSRSVYSLFSDRKAKQGGFVIEASVFSHIRAYREDGFDSKPASHAELVWLLEQTIFSAKNYGALFIVGLASPTGWAPEAREVISGEGTARGFSSIYISPCLIDLRDNSLVFNSSDNRLKPFISVFSGDLNEEVIRHVMDFVDTKLLSRDSQTLKEVVEATGTDAVLVKEAFTRLKQRGGYTLSQLNDLGLTILRHG
jgi:excisionase family DNA binding protein